MAGAGWHSPPNQLDSFKSPFSAYGLCHFANRDNKILIFSLAIITKGFHFGGKGREKIEYTVHISVLQIPMHCNVLISEDSLLLIALYNKMLGVC